MKPNKLPPIVMAEMIQVPFCFKIKSPPTNVPSKIDKKVPELMSAFPLISSSSSKCSGKMPYLIGPKKLDCVPNPNRIIIKMEID